MTDLFDQKNLPKTIILVLAVFLFSLVFILPDATLEQIPQKLIDNWMLLGLLFVGFAVTDFYLEEKLDLSKTKNVFVGAFLGLVLFQLIMASFNLTFVAHLILRAIGSGLISIGVYSMLWRNDD